MSGRAHDAAALGAWSRAAAPGNRDAELLRLGALLARTWRVAHHLWNASEAVEKSGGAREEAEALDKLAEDRRARRSRSRPPSRPCPPTRSRA